MISCGEPSGDLYAGALVAALASREPGLQAFGLGGERLKAAGAELVADLHGLSVTGLTEALRVLPRSWATYRRLVAAARDCRPAALVLVDYPDFNFRLMAAVKKLGVPIVYYVAPQLWAWRPRRIETMKAVVNLVLPIFPFEEELYRRAGMNVRFVGHPLIDLARPSRSRESLLTSIGLDPKAPVLALLPGSRPNEVRRLAPVLADAAELVAARVAGLQCLVARAPQLSDSLFTPFQRPGLRLRSLEGQADAVLQASDAVVTASGTATVQAALHGTPMVVVYRLSPLSYRLGKPLATVDTYAMVNLIAGRRVVTELIQDACTPQAVAEEAVRLLVDPDARARMVKDLHEVRHRLGEPGASARAAGAILELVESSRVES
jgi:lipid-A-disaccharide synthase